MSSPENRQDGPGSPRLSDGIVALRPLLPEHVAAHLAGEDDEIRRWFCFPRPSPHGRADT